MHVVVRPSVEAHFAECAPEIAPGRFVARHERGDDIAEIDFNEFNHLCAHIKYLLVDVIPILFDQFNQCVCIVHMCFGVYHENVIGILFFGEISVQNKCEIALVVWANGMVGYAVGGLRTLPNFWPPIR